MNGIRSIFGLDLKNAKNRLVILAVSVLVFAGVVAMALRLIVTGSTHQESLESRWRINYTIKFRPNGKAAAGWIALPANHENFQILTESFTHSLVEVTFNQNPEHNAREVRIFSPPKAKTVRFEAQFDIIFDKGKVTPPFISEILGPEAMENYLRDEEGIQASSPLVLKTFSEIPSEDDNPENILLQIFNYCGEIKSASRSEIGRKLDPMLSKSVGVIESGQGTILGRARTMVALCRAGRIPARMVSGFLFTDLPVKQPHHWMEAYVEGKWQPYDPAFKVYHNLGPQYLPLRRDGTKIIVVSEARDPYIHCSVKRKEPPSQIAVSSESRLLSILDFTNLPPRVSEAVSLILLLPLGGLIVSIFSNILGLRSFGYFIPALIGISFVDVKWVPGITVFLVIMIIGLGGRAFFNKLNLSKMSRLSLVLLFVVIGLAITVSVLDIFNIRPSSRALLLPMVSLTMMIEAFQTRFEANGPRSAFRKLGITLLVAFCCWLLCSIDKLQWAFLNFPELEFFVAAALVLAGSYKVSKATHASQSPHVGRSTNKETPEN